MKKIIPIIICAALILVFYFSDKGYNPYSGSYVLKSNANLVLRLSKDNSFMLYNAGGKRSDVIKGKYQVENNNITLTPNKDNLDKSITTDLHGKVEGKKIIINELNGDFIEY